MKTWTSPVIITRIREYGETDLLVGFFTPDKGLLKGVAKGARRSRRRFVNCLDAFSLVNLEYGLKKEGALYFLYSGKLLNAFPGLRSDFSIMAAAGFMIELTEVLFPSGVADSGLFDLLKAAFEKLSETKKAASVLIPFESRTMALGGYAINTEQCSNCGRIYAGQGRAVFNREKGTISCLRCGQISAIAPPLSPAAVEVLRRMQTLDPEEFRSFSIADEVGGEILPVLRLHREYRIEKTLRTAKYLE